MPTGTPGERGGWLANETFRCGRTLTPSRCRRSDRLAASGGPQRANAQMPRPFFYCMESGRGIRAGTVVSCLISGPVLGALFLATSNPNAKKIADTATEIIIVLIVERLSRFLAASAFFFIYSSMPGMCVFTNLYCWYSS